MNLEGSVLCASYPVELEAHKIEMFLSPYFYKMEEVTADQLKLNGRYFVREGNETYFGTFLGRQRDHLRMLAGHVDTGEVALMYFHANRYYTHQIYRCIPWIRYQWEQYWLNQILRDITGDDTFDYSILP